MIDTATQMAIVLYDEGVDLQDDHAITQALISAGFSTTNINVLREDAIDAAYEMLTTDGGSIPEEV